MTTSKTKAGRPEGASVRQFFRPVVRQASIILPRTGERVKRSITLRDPALFEDGSDVQSDGDDAPLLRGRTSALPATESTFSAFWGRSRQMLSKGYQIVKSQTSQNILKCSIAYFLASMATFVPAIRDLLGKQDGKHLVATITVYFHPARSAGSMTQATILALIAYVYAALISFTSMGVSMFFAKRNMLTEGHVIVLVVFCGGGLGFVGWLKQRLGDPLVNVACSLTSLAIITVLTKEGAVQAGEFSEDKVVQVLKMVIMGIVIATVVSLVVRPVSARKELRKSLMKTTDSFGEVLIMITRSFLTGSEDEMKHPAFIAAAERYQTVYSSLTKHLLEAKYEHYLLGSVEEYNIEKRLVECMQRLSQSIGGLRSAAATQFTLLSQSDANDAIHASYDPVEVHTSVHLSDLAREEESRRTLAPIAELPEDTRGQLNGVETPEPRKQDGITAAASPADIFSMFIYHLGPPMKSLAFTLKQILDDLPFVADDINRIAYQPNFKSSLMQASDLFSKARKEALQLLYQTKELNIDRSMEVAADFEEVAASCGYFSSSLLDFAEDMLVYLDILEGLKAEVEERKSRTWGWYKLWNRDSVLSENQQRHDVERGGLVIETAESGLSRSVPDPTGYDGTSDPKEPRNLMHRFSQLLYQLSRFFRRDDLKFAVKVGAGAALFAMFSFNTSTRRFYQHWRGEWGLLSYMLVCSMTIGASNTTGWQRFYGTCLGAMIAIICWITSFANPFVLAFLGWLTSLGCFYIILAQGKGPMGRFILLTYNLSALYAYSLHVKDEEDDEDEGGINPEIWSIALHRSVAVLVGCVWGIIVTRVVWPISARRKFQDGLSVLWLRMGLIWRRDPLALLLEGRSENQYMDIREETGLQGFLSRLQALRQAASSEFEFRGPFPKQAFGRILESTSRMIDAFHALNVLIIKDLKASPGETQLLRYTADEREYLSKRISHLFSVLASSLKFELPLNDAMPNIEQPRDRLLAKIFEFRKRSAINASTADDDYELLYAYALVTGQLSAEINKVGKEIEQLYGVLNEEMLKLQ